MHKKENGRAFHNDFVNEEWMYRVEGRILFSYTYQIARNGKIRKQLVHEALVPSTIIEYLWDNYQLPGGSLDNLYAKLHEAFEDVLDGVLAIGSDTVAFHFEFDLPEGHVAEVGQKKEHEDCILRIFQFYYFDNE